MFKAVEAGMCTYLGMSSLFWYVQANLFSLFDMIYT